MSAPSPDSLSLGANVNFKVDPTIPQSSQASAAQINESRDQQVALINATTGGRRRRRQKTRRRYRGGDTGTIVVAPLPLGAGGANAQANNVAMSSLFANAASASKYDNEVQPASSASSRGGGKRRHTRRLSSRRTYRRKTKRRRNRKSRKSRR